MKILVASDDERKINEIKDILKEYEIISLKESGIELNAEEIGQTFEQKLKNKSNVLSKIYKRNSISIFRRFVDRLLRRISRDKNI